MKNSKSVVISLESFRLLLKCIKRYHDDLENTLCCYADVDFCSLSESAKKRVDDANDLLPKLEELELELYGFGG